MGIALVSIVMVVIACWWLLPDETLNPGAEKLLTVRPAPPAGQNGYFMFWGMRASPELDPHAVGQKIVAEHGRLVAAKGDLAKFEFESFLGNTPLSIPGPSQRLCAIEKEICLAVYQGMQPRIESDLAKHRLVVDHYRAIRGYPDFHEVMSLTLPAPIPQYSPIMKSSDLVDASIALRVAMSATRAAALTELAAEIGSWRRILRQSDTLITKMFSAALLHRKYQLASEIIGAYPDVVRQYPAKLAEMTSPLLVAETNLARSLGGEFRLAAHAYRDIRQMTQEPGPGAETGDPFDKLFNPIYLAGGYRPNATINRVYSMFQEVMRLSTAPPGEILSGHAALSQKQNDFDLFMPDVFLYNPIGKILVSVAAPDFSAYSFRLHDLAGYSRLIELQRRMVEGDVRPEKRAGFLAGAGPALMDPYSGKPMDWNAANATISFVAHGKRFVKDGRILVELGRR